MFLTTPVPNKIASAAIANKAAVSKAVFAELPAELKTLAFTVTGIEDLKVLQKARDIIAKLPLGEDYEKLKAQLADTISPYLANSKAAQLRAELLMRLHGGQAYAAAQFRVMDRQRDVFPYWQYMTHGDGRVRASHAALNKKIFHHTSPFWQLHYPPWEYLCRCSVIPLTQWDVDQIREQDKNLPPVKRRFMEGPLLDKLLNEHILFSPLDDGTTVSVKAPSIDNPNGYLWHPGTLGVPLEKLKAGFDKDLWQQFEDKAKKTKLSPQMNLWNAMQKQGKAYKAEPAKEVITPEKKKAILKALGMTDQQFEDWKKTSNAPLPTPSPIVVSPAKAKPQPAPPALPVQPIPQPELGPEPAPPPALPVQPIPQPELGPEPAPQPAPVPQPAPQPDPAPQPAPQPKPAPRTPAGPIKGLKKIV